MIVVHTYFGLTNMQVIPETHIVWLIECFSYAHYSVTFLHFCLETETNYTVTMPRTNCKSSVEVNYL